MTTRALSAGDTTEKFGRRYVFVNPNSFTGPGTWRLATPDAISGGGGGAVESISGDVPIEVEMLNATANVSIDITELTEETN